MSLIEALKKLQDERADHAKAIARIDAELQAAREALGLPTSFVANAPSHHEEKSPEHRVCVRCGERFTPKVGVSGRFCSQKCYAGGMEVEERRMLIFSVLKDGHKFPSQIHQRLDFVSRSTIMNDLYALSKQGHVGSFEDGWGVAVEEDAQPSDDDQERVEVPDPLATRSEPIRFPTSPQSKAS